MPGIHGGGGRPDSAAHAPVVFRMVSKQKQPQTRTALAHGGAPKTGTEMEFARSSF